MKIKLNLTTFDPLIIRKDDVSAICRSSYECYDSDKQEMMTPTSVYLRCGTKFDVFESIYDVERMVFGGEREDVPEPPAPPKPRTTKYIG